MNNAHFVSTQKLHSGSAALLDLFEPVRHRSLKVGTRTVGTAPLQSPARYLSMNNFNRMRFTSSLFPVCASAASDYHANSVCLLDLLRGAAKRESTNRIGFSCFKFSSRAKPIKFLDLSIFAAMCKRSVGWYNFFPVEIPSSWAFHWRWSIACRAEWAASEEQSTFCAFWDLPFHDIIFARSWCSSSLFVTFLSVIFSRIKRFIAGFGRQTSSRIFSPVWTMAGPPKTP